MRTGYDADMRIDLHTHSSISDGTDRPRDLITKAIAAGLDVVAITDHDTTDGWSEATAAAGQHADAISLLRGIEISTTNGTQGQHLLAYEPDPAYPALVEMLTAAAASRHNRTPAMLAKITAAGYHIDPATVTRFAGDGVVGKPHIADALVDAGICLDRDDAFARFVGKGGIANVERFQPDIEDAIAVVRAAGGVPVVAHPWGRKTHITEERFAELATIGLVGIEVDHEDHSPESRDALRAIARNLDLIVTGSSDHHGLGKKGHDLGCNTTDPAEFERLNDLIACRRN